MRVCVLPTPRSRDAFGSRESSGRHLQATCWPITDCCDRDGLAIHHGGITPVRERYTPLGSYICGFATCGSSYQRIAGGEVNEVKTFTMIRVRASLRSLS